MPSHCPTCGAELTADELNRDECDECEASPYEPLGPMSIDDRRQERREAEERDRPFSEANLR